MVSRFRVEPETAAKINHPNVVTIFRFGADDGVTLQELIQQHVPLSVFDKVEIMRQASASLHYAHEKKVVHRGVKPANIMRLRSGIVQVLDFGIARVSDSASTRLTQT